MRIVTLEGTPREMGRAFGESCRQDIGELYARRLHNAITQAKNYGGRSVSEAMVLRVAEECMGPTESFDPEGTAELVGIGEGAGMSTAQIIAMNGLTDLRDVLAWWGGLEEGCSSFVVPKEGAAERETILGQTWDLSSDNLPFVVGVHRRPANGPRTTSLTTVGCLSLIGMNEHGIAIGTTNLRTNDARPGVTYLSLIHRALACATLDDAAARLMGAPRSGAHYYYLADAHGGTLAIETTATRAMSAPISADNGVHCNHCLVPAHAVLEGQQPTLSTHARQARMATLVKHAWGNFDTGAAKRALSDHENGDGAICRHDIGGISSNAAVVMTPARGEILACQGLPCTAEWTALPSPF